MKTHQITIRKVDPLLKQRISRSAKLKSQSINDWVLDAIKSKAGINGSTSDNELSWKKFHGSFSKDAINDDVLRDFDKIDKKMWE